MIFVSHSLGGVSIELEPLSTISKLLRLISNMEF